MKTLSRTLALRLATLLLPLALASACASSTPTRLNELSSEELQQKFHDDLVQILRYDQGLNRTVSFAEQHPELFPKRDAAHMTAEEKRALREVWRETLDYMFALDSIKHFWSDYQSLFGDHKISYVKAFLAGYSAWVVQHFHGLRLMQLTLDSKPLEVLLDEAAPEQGIPAGSFATLKLSIIHVKSLWQLIAGREYLRSLEDDIKEVYCVDSALCQGVHDAMVNYIRASRKILALHGVEQYSYNAFDILSDFTFNAWFPLQKGVAEWMGDTKVQRLHKHLISHEQIDAMRAKMEPGDIIVSRHNWYLSNIGLPGFWPHAELYIGSPEELKAYFDDPAVVADLKARSSAAPDSFPEWLAAQHPERWKTYSSPDAEGQPYRIIEAISEGVSFSSAYKGMGSDYIGVIRPRMDKVAKARAIERAFSYLGRPYDFNFDFVSDESLVCTELVFKAWQPDTDKPGLMVPLEEVVGRTTLPANSLVRYFDERYDDPERPLDFVYFLSGREGQKDAVVSDVETFRKSWKRPKWDIVQK